MHLGEPKQALVGKVISGIENEQSVKRLREREIDSGYSPHENEEKAPESKRAVQVPTDPREMCPPVHSQTATPVLNSRPPYDGSCQTKRRHTDSAKAIHKAAV
jgi:hypothetical protein